MSLTPRLARAVPVIFVGDTIRDVLYALRTFKRAPPSAVHRWLRLFG